MNTWIPWLVLCGAALGCTPKSNDAGVLDTGGVSDEGDEGGGTIGTSTGSGSDGADDGMSSTPTSGVDDGSDDVATGEVVPSACVEMGWDDSYATFMQMASAAGSTYWYTIQTGGDQGFGGYDCLYRTTIVVESGAVVRREFEILGPPDGEPDFECTNVPYVEEGEALGTNDEPLDREPWTLAQLYEGCCAEVLIQPEEENYVTFEVDRQGLMSACSYFSMNCADGCDAGPEGYGRIAIESITFGPWSP